MWRTMGITIFTFVGLILSNVLNMDSTPLSAGSKSIDPPFYQCDSAWVDSVFNSMSEDEKIGQLFMIAAYSNKDKQHEDYLKMLIEDYNIGGLIFMQGGPVRQATMHNSLQESAKVKLLIAIDGEWSLSMRLDSTVMYPRQMMLGAIQDDNLIYEMGAEFARQFKRMGIHVNFAPVIDVNNNPENPVINSRSFGEDPENVARKGWMYAKGMQDNGVLATGKHFPGHGDTNVDSHKDLPVINHSYERLDSIEFYPFKYLFKKGLGAVMVAHLYIPALDTTSNLATTLSPRVVSELLKGKMDFKGLIFTDALNMQGVAKYFPEGEVDVMALLAGNDILLFSGDVPRAVRKIKEAIAEGRITQEEIDERVKKILMAKYWAGLNNYKPVDTENLVADLNNTDANWMQQKLVENAITTVTNKNEIIPITNLDSVTIASLSFGCANESTFQNRLKYYADVKNYIYNKDVGVLGYNGLMNELKMYDIVIISVHGTNRNPKSRFGVNKLITDFTDTLATKTNIILNVFANPYSLSYFRNLDKMAAVMLSYNDWGITNDFAAQAVFGGITSKGRLPVSINKDLVSGAGVDTKALRLKYTMIPEEAGIDSKLLYKVDSIFNSGINNKAFPGGQVLAAKDGVVFYYKSFGKHTYEGNRRVENLDIYDLASVTKVVSTTNSLMYFYERNYFKLEEPLSKYLPGLDTTNKKDINFYDILSHQACLTPWIPFFKKTIVSDSIRGKIYAPAPDSIHTILVSDNLYMDSHWLDSVWYDIFTSKLLNGKNYRYSDLGMIMIGKLLEQWAGKPLDLFVSNQFYKPLGAWSLGYNPSLYFNKDMIVPTENDKFFRQNLVHGYVHDQAASLMGGVAGHAGLFSNANDLAKVLQIYLNGGQYAGKQFFEPETIKWFTSPHNDTAKNRRALGFDRPIPAIGKGPACDSASYLSFGHGGFTGTIIWADPEYNLSYVFLSNRVYPEAENNKIISMDIRTNIQQVFYDAIISYNIADSNNE
jgi:beta-N-acetylhexosaminidase